MSAHGEASGDGSAGNRPQPGWAEPSDATSGLVPMMVLMPEQQRAAMLGSGFAMPAAVHGPSRLDALYDEAMSRFDAFCFWYARPPRSRAGLRQVAERLETYGSAEALRIAGDVREALAATFG